ncbi:MULTISPECIES: winged helix-turn-helix domain-containing protein [Arthrobacter]|uniref:Winged helix-turn-helix domain-containing protein n=2 Tax=Arthrobacter TaxID=1663 RepID=A0ABU9KPX7_9MICC|nr:winged helix-turn-helix domain-containing protein [Arthrobacter sp. YJM1]MDP5228129.1 winged helix-turn-helix domain-containing protein [Arthrobacter sp. YJM1]
MSAQAIHHRSDTGHPGPVGRPLSAASHRGPVPGQDDGQGARPRMAAHGAGLFFQTPQELTDEQFARLEELILTRLHHINPEAEAILWNVPDAELEAAREASLAEDAAAIAAADDVAGSGDDGAHVHEVDVDLAADQVRVDGAPVSFSGVEYRLLRYLVQHCSRSVPRQELADFLISLDATAAPRSIDVYVSRIRRKLGPVRHVVETVRGGGYRFQAGRHSRVRGPAEYSI